ncbi:MAG TPA: VOC family protein [Terracidiphilus sp.]|nr:VOC family protein [Terracidiphilus sp.]
MAAVLGCSFLASATLSQTQAPPAASQPSSRGNRPALVDACLITRDVKRLVRFYEPILQSKAKWSGQDYAELATSAGVLAIFSSSAQEKYIPGSAEAAKNRTVILEFEVADVDAEYKRLQDLVKIWVKAPTTQPWGTRSIYFRDPDSNLINFFTHLPAP